MNKPYWVLLIALIVAGAVLVAGAPHLYQTTLHNAFNGYSQTSEQHDAFLAQFVSSLLWRV